MQPRALQRCLTLAPLAVLVHGAMGWLLLHGSAADGGAQPAPREIVAMQLVAPSAAITATREALDAPAARDKPPAAPAASADRPAASMPAAAASAAALAPPMPERIAPPLIAPPAFHAPAELEHAARPRSAPDIASLAGLPWSGLPMRLRLFIDAAGTVVDVTVLQAHEEGEVVERVRAMFLATGFVAGRRSGEDVASYKDVELTLGPAR